MAQPTPRPLGPPRSHIDTHTARGRRHTHAAAACRHTRTPPSPAWPLAHGHGMHTHTHTHTRQGPGGGGRLWVVGWGRGSLGLQVHSPPHSHRLQAPPPAPRPPPRERSCAIGLENCKRNANWKTNQNPRAEGQPQIHSTFRPPRLPAADRLSVLRLWGRVGVGGRPSPLCFPAAEGSPRPPARPGWGSEHPLGSWPRALAPGSRGWHLRGAGPRPRARGAQSCRGPRRRAGGPSP